jgi:hypothetical protein
VRPNDTVLKFGTKANGRQNNYVFGTAYHQLDQDVDYRSPDEGTALAANLVYELYRAYITI